jgi:hypothetical protein
MKKELMGNNKTKMKGRGKDRCFRRNYFLGKTGNIN